MSERAAIIAEQVVRQVLDEALKTFKPLGKAHAELFQRTDAIIAEVKPHIAARIDALLTEE